MALVEGRFPSTPSSGIVFNRPLESFKLNSVQVKFYNEPKESKTTFHKIKEYKIDGVNGPGYYSLVRCIPFQGRTHQIRLHLMQMGHPIINDYLYNDLDASKRVTNYDYKIQPAISSIYKNYDNKLNKDTKHNCDMNKTHPTNDNSYWQENLTRMYGTNVPFCLECHLGGYVGQRLDDTDPMFMCLHAWKHSIESLGQVFEAEPPKWATDISFITNLVRERMNR